MRNYDFTPLYRSLVGFDRMADLIDAASQTSATQTSYPPYNVAQISEDSYQIQLAVAGFAQDDFEIQTHQNVLTVSAKKDTVEADNDDGITYLHRGIAERGFERRFQLADHVRVTDADLSNGLLVISLTREVPEALRPQKIAIGTARSKKPAGLAKGDKSLIPTKASGKAKAA
ncbi:MAG: Hsp20 family protein [Maricaulaceae bacterium]